jgi:hypothetical protein
MFYPQEGKIMEKGEALKIAKDTMAGQKRSIVNWNLGLNRIRSTHYGRLAQRQSIGLTHRGLQVQILYGTPFTGARFLGCAWVAEMESKILAHVRKFLQRQ